MRHQHSLLIHVSLSLRALTKRVVTRFGLCFHSPYRLVITALLLVSCGLSTAQAQNQTLNSLRQPEPNLPVFTHNLIFGSVYWDKNNNGIQDKNEPGIAGIRLITLNGTIVVTDMYGRYALPDVRDHNGMRASNFMLKLDSASLPAGYQVLSRESVVIRLTRGTPQRIDFRVGESPVNG